MGAKISALLKRKKAQLQPEEVKSDGKKKFKFE